MNPKFCESYFLQMPSVMSHLVSSHFVTNAILSSTYTGDVASLTFINPDFHPICSSVARMNSSKYISVMISPHHLHYSPHQK